MPKPETQIALGTVTATGKNVLGAIEGDAVPQTFIPKLIALWERGEFPFDEMIKQYPFDQIEQAIADTQSGAAVKAVLVMP